MLVRVLGSLDVVTSDGPVTVTGSTQRRLLAALTLQTPTAVSADRLADLLGLSESALRTAVSRLRAELGPAVVTEAPGYALRGVDVDAKVFEAQLDQARTAAAGPDRLERLDEALAQWRGDPYPEVADTDWGRPDVVRLGELRANALEDRAEILIELGRSAEAIAGLERLRADHPLRDRPCALAMRALAAQGRPSEALRAYQDHRHYLGDELGTEPSVELVELERRIATGWHDTPAAPLPTSAGPTGTVTFLFTDIEGSTRLWDHHGEHMAAALLTHDEILRSAIDTHHGHVFHHPGDGYAAAFSLPDDAMAAAVDAQRGLVVTEWSRFELRVRMSVHTGVTQERDGNYFGPTLNQAARLLELGHGGQILVSAVTAALLTHPVDLVDLGDHRLRDLAAAMRVYQLRSADLPDDFPPLRSLGAVPTNLPLVPTSFVGRAQDVAVLRELLAAHRVVTLVGPGGIGKTRLALQAAADTMEQYPGGVWFVELAQVLDPADVASVTAALLRVPATANHTPLDDLVGWLRSVRAMLVLDNCEHLVVAAARVAGAVTSGCPGVTILATSREGLAVPGEQIWPVSPLPVDGAAITLFDDRAREVVPSFELAAHREAVEEICRRLDGVPLAIELAAARVQSLAPTDIAVLLDDRFRLLTGGRRTSLERHRTLRAAVEWSYDLLDPAARLLFARLATFSGWFDLPAVRAVCTDDSLDDFAAIEALERLIGQSMVTAEDRVAGRRYRMLETLRQYGLERLVAHGAVDLVADRHAHHYATWIEHVVHQLEEPEELRALAELDDGWDNLRVAVASAIDHRDVDTALRISAALVWEAMRQDRGCSDWASQAVALPGAEANPLVIDALTLKATGVFLRRRLDEHEAILSRAEQLCAERGWEPTAALLCARIGHAIVMADHAGFAFWTDAALDRARRHGDTIRESRHLTDQASVWGLRDEGALGFRVAEDAVALARSTGNPSAELYCHMNLVTMLPDYRDQLPPLRQLVRQAEILRHERLLSVMRPLLAGIEARAGDLSVAIALARGVLRTQLDTGAWYLWSWQAPDIFYVLVRSGCYAEAATMHGHVDSYLALNRARTHDYEVELATLIERLGPEELAVRASRGRLMSPRELGEQALAGLDALVARTA